MRKHSVCKAWNMRMVALSFLMKLKHAYMHADSFIAECWVGASFRTIGASNTGIDLDLRVFSPRPKVRFKH